MQTCSKCGELKPFSEFHKLKAQKNGHRPDCKACHQVMKKAYNPKRNIKRKQNPRYQEKNLESNLRTAYGITLEEYNALVFQQSGVCKVCKQLPTETSNQTNRLVVDHCHKTGRVRGLMCPNCNCALGHLKESVQLCQELAQYILDHKG